MTWVTLPVYEDGPYELAVDSRFVFWTHLELTKHGHHTTGIGCAHAHGTHPRQAIAANETIGFLAAAA